MGGAAVTVDISERALVDAMSGVQYDLGSDLADIWFGESQEVLAEADSQYDDSNYFPILQSAQPPRWDDKRQAWVFSYTHVASIFAEYGTEPHDIEAKNADFLAFEWPDAPPEIQERFKETFPTVFFKKVRHPGTPRIGYVAAGRKEAQMAARRGLV